MKTSAMLTAIALVLTPLFFSPTFVLAAPLPGTGLKLPLNATAIAAYNNGVAELKAHAATINDYPLSDSTESWGNPKKAVICLCADVNFVNCAYPVVTDKQCQEVRRPFARFVPYVTFL
jgi:hypothetical protein